MTTRKPLGRPLTVDELTQAVGTGETPAEAMAAQAWWERYAPAYALNWLSAVPDTTPRPLLRRRA